MATPLWDFTLQLVFYMFLELPPFIAKPSHANLQAAVVAGWLEIMETQQDRLHNQQQLQNPQKGGRLVKTTHSKHNKHAVILKLWNSCQVFFFPSLRLLWSNRIRKPHQCVAGLCISGAFWWQEIRRQPSPLNEGRRRANSALKPSEQHSHRPGVSEAETLWLNVQTTSAVVGLQKPD